MRLGDLDALEIAIDKERQILIEQGRPGAEHIVVHHARRLVEEAPTIDAIPVEWLDDRANDITRAPLFRRYAQQLLDEWQKEQEAR